MYGDETVSTLARSSKKSAHQPLALTARLRKLRAMTPAEVMSRLGDKAFEVIERRQLRGRPRDPDERLAQAVAPSLSRGADWRDRLLAARPSQARFYPAFAEGARIRRHFEQQWPSLLDDSRRWADAAVDHQFEFFGETFAYPSNVEWHRDPVSGRQWPLRFHADVPTSG